LSLFELAQTGSDFIISAFVFLALAQQIRLEKLVFTLYLLVVLFHSFQTLHELLNGKCSQVDVP